MFDNHPVNNPGGSAPSNLPFGEPDDIFSATDDNASSLSAPSQGSLSSAPYDPVPNPLAAPPAPQPPPDVAPSALSAGILKPKAPDSFNPPSYSGEFSSAKSTSSAPISPGGGADPIFPEAGPPAPANPFQAPPGMSGGFKSPTEMPDAMRATDSFAGLGGASANSVSSGDIPGGNIGDLSRDNIIHEPTLSRGIMTMIIIVVVGLVVGGAGWFVYRLLSNSAPSGFENQAAQQAVEFEDPLGEDPFGEENTNEKVPVIVDTKEGNQGANIGDQKVNLEERLILGEPLDTDADGISDEKERERGTDPQNWDSDDDGLSDSEEILIWKTNPLNSDTDGDTYKDGEEVKAGYNPSGEGKFLSPPVADVIK